MMTVANNDAPSDNCWHMSFLTIATRCTVTATLLVSGCVYSTSTYYGNFTREELLADLDRASHNDLYRGLFYCGTEDGNHHLRAVYEYAGDSFYVVKRGMLSLPFETTRRLCRHEWIPMYGFIDGQLKAKKTGKNVQPAGENKKAGLDALLGGGESWHLKD
jgi:hypothetical protein